MTPLEISFIVDAYVQNKKSQSEELISVAYVQAMWTIQWLGKKHPKPLNEILKSAKNPNKTMTSQDMLNQVKQLNAMFGGETKIEE